MLASSDAALQTYSPLVTAGVTFSLACNSRQSAAEKEAAEKQLDLIMDIDRIQGLQQDEEREQARQEKLKAEAAMIRTQIAEREVSLGTLTTGKELPGSLDP